MITRFNGFINESLLDKMKGKDSKEIWKSLGYDKIFDTPEEFFIEVIKGMKIKEQTKYPDSVFWVKNGEILFEQNFECGYLYVNYAKIWKIFKLLFEYNNQYISELIEDMVKVHLNWTDLTPTIAKRSMLT